MRADVELADAAPERLVQVLVDRREGRLVQPSAPHSSLVGHHDQGVSRTGEPRHGGLGVGLEPQVGHAPYRIRKVDVEDTVAIEQDDAVGTLAFIVDR
jgi:hypothetical protein